VTSEEVEDGGLTFTRADNRATLAEVRQILAAAMEAGVGVRAFGGAGIALRCELAQSPGILSRGFSDVDVVLAARDHGGAGRLFEELGYVGDRRFNLTHGHVRMMFDHPEHGHLDVFVGDFVMCHTLKLRDRLTVHDETLAPSDLLLTKLQVADLTLKDVQDVAALLATVPLSDDESGVRLAYIGGLLASDWGWWRTVTENLWIVRERLDRLDLPQDVISVIAERIDELAAAIETAPKSKRWRLRSRVGDRVPWREEPESAR